MTVATRSNEEIKKDVVDQLCWDARVDASDIRITVSDGEVVLSGTVPNYTAYQAADENAWCMSGVRNVRNDIAIKYPTARTLPVDSELKTNIENILLLQPDIDSTDIDIKVRNGDVILSGSVDAFWKKVRAEELVFGVKGVVGVTNELAVVPTQEITDKAIAEDIESAMERHFELDPDLIDMKVENGKVTLSGSVSSLPSFRAAQKIAQNTPGVIMVDNELVIR